MLDDEMRDDQVLGSDGEDTEDDEPSDDDLESEDDAEAEEEEAM